MESSHFWPSVLHDPLYKILFFDFWFRPPNAQNLLPKICTISPISRLVWQIDRRYLGPLGGYRGWPIQWNRAKCCGADPCCHGHEILARRGDPYAYRLDCLFFCQRDNWRTVRDIATKFSKHHPVVERAENGYIGVHGWWFDVFDILLFHWDSCRDQNTVRRDYRECVVLYRWSTWQRRSHTSSW